MQAVKVIHNDQQTKKSLTITTIRFLVKSQMIKTNLVKGAAWPKEKKVVEPKLKPLEKNQKALQKIYTKNIGVFDNVDYLADAREQLSSGQTHSGNRFAHYNLKGKK